MSLPNIYSALTIKINLSVGFIATFSAHVLLKKISMFLSDIIKDHLYVYFILISVMMFIADSRFSIAVKSDRKSCPFQTEGDAVS